MLVYPFLTCHGTDNKVRASKGQAHTLAYVNMKTEVRQIDAFLGQTYLESYNALPLQGYESSLSIPCWFNLTM